MVRRVRSAGYDLEELENYMDKSTSQVTNYYDTVAATIHEQYERDAINDPTKEYPANYFRLQLLLNSFTSKGLRRVIEVGVGEGTPLATLARAGMDVWGFDISAEMVKTSQARMRAIGKDPSHIALGDSGSGELYPPSQ